MSYSPVDDIETKWPKLVSTELFTKVASNANYLIDSLPVGTILPILLGFPGVPAPDSSLWQVCDGSLIDSEDSPLNGNSTPDYTNSTYMRGFDAIGNVGNYGGSNTLDLNHDHNNKTGDWASSAADGGAGTDVFNTQNHAHLINADFITPINVEPVNFTVLHYIKIN